MKVKSVEAKGVLDDLLANFDEKEYKEVKKEMIMEDYPLDDNTLFPMIMKCPKCGKEIWEGTSTCPLCGCDVNFTTKKKD